MQLCYRGICYESQSATLPTVESGYSPKFRGCQYHLRRVAVNLETHRRVSDKEEIRYRFLGQTYSRPHILI